MVERAGNRNIRAMPALNLQRGERDTAEYLCQACLRNHAFKDFLPKAHQRNKPDPVPVALLGQLAVARSHQDRGHTRALLLHALTTTARLSREIRIFGVITHPIDDGVRRFCARWGFEDLHFDPKRAMIVRIKDLEKSGIS
ncbi:MAG: hypothetical protein V7608_3432 [Hyphomicrobiales bacterium]